MSFDILRKARTQYYRQGNSFMSDEEYDKLYDEMKILYPNDPFFKEVGANEEFSHWKKVSHEQYKMGSLGKVNTSEDMEDWVNKQSIKEFVVEEKLDGISIRLVYSDENLIAAITRGNGYEGEDIFRNVIKMQGIPKKINNKGSLVIRGEILMTHKDFNSLPVKMKNPRNAAAGIAKSLDGIYCKYLTVMCTSIMNRNDLGKIDALKFLDSLGFITVKNYYATNSKDIEFIYQEYIRERRSILDYDIDGLVIKTNKVFDDDWEHPKTEIAYKFPNQYRATVLRDVEWHSSGNRISPIGIVDPVELAGATVTRVTLNNIDFINEMNLKINSKIEITRANEVIPKISSVLMVGDYDITPPMICPICKSPTYQDGKFFYCSNNDCSSKVVRKCLRWLEAHNCKGVAESTIETLYENGCFDSLFTFLQITERKDLIDFILNELENFGKRKCEILINEINKTKKTTILKFMDGLDFKDMGVKKWKTILDYCVNTLFHEGISINTFLDFISSYNLKMISGIAEETQKKIEDSYLNNIHMIRDLLGIVSVEDFKIDRKSSGKLTGKSFCFTGTLNSLKRFEAQRLVEENGGKNLSGVNSKLDFLVTNELSGSQKSKDAIALGIKVISESEFLDMIK